LEPIADAGRRSGSYDGQLRRFWGTQTMRRFLTAKTLILFASLGSVTDVSAQTHAIAGRWSNDDTAEVIEITPDPIGGWRFHQSDIGDGNISLANAYGANIYVSGRHGLSCYYVANITDGGRRMSWLLRRGDGRCLARTFTKAE